MKAQDACRASWVEPKFSTEHTVSPVAVQARNEHSLLNHYKTFIALRNTSKALTAGGLEPVLLENKGISAFMRTHPEESLLVLHNLTAQEALVALFCGT